MQSRKAYQRDYEERSTRVTSHLGSRKLEILYRALIVTEIHMRLSAEKVHICLPGMSDIHCVGGRYART